jgi:hypothetical protein
MATDFMVAGLFSTPEQYQQAQLAQQQDMAMRMAQLTPEQRAAAGMQVAGYQIGSGIGSALGAQDPQLKAISAIRELSSKYDTNTSGGVAALATELQQRGMQQQAFQLGQKALEMRKLEAEAQAKTMEKLTTEQKNAAGLADSSGAVRGSPEWTDAYKAELTRLTTGNKGANIKEIGVAEGTRQPVYFDAGTDTQFVMGKDASGKQVRMPFTGGVDRTTAKTSVDARNMQESEWVKGITKEDVQRASEMTKAADAARTSNTQIVNMLSSLDQGVAAGKFANTKTGLSSVLAEFNLATPKQIQMLNNSQTFDSAQGQMVLAAVKKLGANPSNADRDYAEKLAGSRVNTETAIRQLLQHIADTNKKTIEEASNMRQYGDKNKGLAGYKPLYGEADINTAPKPAAALDGMSLQQLQALKAAKEKEASTK